ncbi:MAG: DNA polymerase IV [Dehalococcoidia bacterium]|nr:DNA polymerase IV [Dehalococcoidia bacterium]
MSDRATVLHVDLDAFYVSMELRRRPELRGLPVVVAGGLGNRGVVNTASYEARRFGVRSAMPVSQARRLCPQAVFLESDYHYYSVASKQFHAILRDFSPLVEPAGADEAYMDVAGTEQLFGAAAEVAARIKARVNAEIGITASVGVSVNKLVSKVASDAGKPNGLVVVEAGTEAAFFAPRPIRELPMVGRRTAEVLTSLGIRTIGDIARTPEAALVAKFGKHGAELRQRALGIFDAPVVAQRGDAKSISRDITFDTDEPDGDRLRAVLRSQAERIAKELSTSGKAARTVSLRLRFPPFETLSRSFTPSVAVDVADEVYAHGVALFERAWAENDRRPVRLIGLGVHNIVERARQLRLGETLEADRLQDTVEALRDRYGGASVLRANELQRNPYRHRDGDYIPPFSAPKLDPAAAPDEEVREAIDGAHPPADWP